jgi:hypothetical protein
MFPGEAAAAKLSTGGIRLKPPSANHKLLIIKSFIPVCDSNRGSPGHRPDVAVAIRIRLRPNEFWVSCLCDFNAIRFGRVQSQIEIAASGNANAGNVGVE